MDAKKDAIRAEDMAKGVYSPVGKLPRPEPQRAAQTHPMLSEDERSVAQWN